MYRTRNPLILSALVRATVCVLTCGVVSRSAQEVPQATIALTKIVKIPVTVLDKNGRLVLDMAKEEFRLFEDKRAQPIELLSPGSSEPLTVGLLIDVSGTRRWEIPGAERRAATEFFRRLLRKGDLAFVAKFNDQANVLCNFTDDPTVVEYAIADAFLSQPRGGTALYDVIFWASRSALATRPGRRALVVVSDGLDNASHHTRDEAIQAALESRAQVYFVYLPESSAFRTSSQFSRRGAGVARGIAEETGGHSLLAENEKRMNEAFFWLAELIRSSYILTYSSESENRPAKLQSVKVKTTRKGLKVFYPKGYITPAD